MAQLVKRQHAKILLNCAICGTQVECYDDTIKVKCSMCAVHCGPPMVIVQHQQEEKIDTGFPRGWRFYKQFVHKDGRVFERGIENVSLRGKLDVTVIIEKPKLTRFEKEAKKMAKEKKSADIYNKKMSKLKKIKEKSEKE